ncbi:type II toxin-antitoxin system Phd/YefM family antitoxin [Pseudonocardia sp. KRD291]|uniref:type II toxin-antitoxin system Phd/YefM family antitoxin n=1 Tax=Pseudonocardia sp. KRD291 TaxID=2792007 RepID=UPI001C4A2249|nr:type II toxin-antitoxin system prevent-host-death family antitoxin [Pseudonocardia sp. KRD291]MBW0101292.1 type II toxin-antitoxin system prevent-host-death family antitoxin [Pseudonocardia sp. KRD291]
MARTIPHRELRNNSSAVLRDVAAGETVHVTNNGEVVAVLVPPPRAGVASLRVRPATVRGGFAGLARVRMDRPVQDVLDELRAER